MYVDNVRICNKLRFKNVLPNEQGEYVFCVPWLNNGKSSVQQHFQTSNAKLSHIVHSPSDSDLDNKPFYAAAVTKANTIISELKNLEKV